MEINLILKLGVGLLSVGFGVVNGFEVFKPSFVSNWTLIKSQADQESELIFEHGLNVIPYKVLVEVMVDNNGQHYIFNGRGSGIIDDDRPYVYGGIIYLYDSTTVRVLAPNEDNTEEAGVAVYTGEDGWIGPDYIKRSFKEVMVRVKVWIPRDLPEPDFIHNWTYLSVYDEQTFQEIPHSLNNYPEYVVVQVKGIDTYISEAQGSTSYISPDYGLYTHVNSGGVIFGLSDRTFRLWYPKRKETKRKYVCIMCFYDGWGNYFNKLTKSGYYRILAWQTSACMNWTKYEEPINNTKPGVSPLDIDVNNTLVSVEVEALDGPNKGFRFYGIDSTVNDGMLGPFGGLLYAYDNSKLLYWVPKEGSTGHIIHIGGMWGDDGTGHVRYSQTSNAAKIRVKIFTFLTEEIYAGYPCPKEEIEGNGSTSVTTGYCYNNSITYACDGRRQHTAGDLYRTCLINGTWSGNVPVCEEIICPEEEVEVDGTSLFTTGHHFNDSITYTCDGKRQHTGGDMHRICLLNESWSGNAPICQEIICPEEEMEVNGTTLFTTGQHFNDSITYTCDGKRQHTGGDLHRICLLNGSWSGNAPICEEIICPEEEVEVNGTILFTTGHHFNDSITYTCDSKRQHTGGDLDRICLLNGSWSGNAPICEEIVCPVEEMEVNAATFLATGHGYNDSIAYVCDRNTRHTGGDLNRTCLINGSWSGNAPTCRDHQRIREAVEKIRKDLTVDKTKTSKFLRLRISAPDIRPSAQTIGYVGVAVLVLVGLLIVVPDISKIFNDIKRAYRGVCQKRHG